MRKLLVSCWLKKIAESSPVTRVAMFDENFFIIVSANFKKREAKTP